MTSTTTAVELRAHAAVRLVANREVRARIRSKVYRISTAALVLLSVATVVVIRLVAGAGNAGAAAGGSAYHVQRLALGIVAGALIYLSMLLTGQLVAQGVVEEKSSRVVELLLAALPPWQLMAGKVAGSVAVGLVQVVVVATAGVVSGVAAGVLPVPVTALASSLAWLVVWFLLGVVMYSMVFASLGALVSRQEDVGGVVAAPLLVIVAGWVIGISILPTDPDNSLVAVLSIVPLFAPTLMPMRIAMGAAPLWQAGMAVALVAAVIPAFVWLAGRIYRNAVLRTGARVRVRDALRA